MERREIIWWNGYEVDDNGIVYRKKDGKIMKQYKQHNGYCAVYLRKDGWTSAVMVHRIVAEAFLPREQGKDVVDHINTIRSDNRLVNLRWVNAEGNANNATTKINRMNAIARRQKLKIK